MGNLVLYHQLHKKQDSGVSSSQPFNNEDWVKLVDDCLRHFSDYLFLGESPFAEQIGVGEGTNIERGKKAQVRIREAIQSLRPQGERPPEPPPREWFNYVVLHDAYVQGLPNREVAARLFVSEGTFHRVRRHAVRGVAKYLADKALSAS